MRGPQGHHATNRDEAPRHVGFSGFKQTQSAFQHYMRAFSARLCGSRAPIQCCDPGHVLRDGHVSRHGGCVWPVERIPRALRRIHAQ